MECCRYMGTRNCCCGINVSIETPKPPPVVIRIEMTEDEAQIFINSWKASENPVTKKIIQALNSR